MLTTTDTDRRQVAIYRDVTAMPYHHDGRTAITEHATHFTVEDAACHGTWMTHDVNTFIIQTYIRQALHIILSEVTYYLVTTGDRHRQATAITLKVTAHALICTAVSRIVGSRSLGSLCHFTAMRFGISSSLALSSLSFLLSLTGFSFRLCPLNLCSSLSFTSHLLFLCLSFGYLAGILTGSSFCLSFFAGQLSSTLTGSGGIRLALCLCGSPSFRSGYFLGYHTVYLGVQGSIPCTLLGNDRLYGLLLLLQ